MASRELNRRGDRGTVAWTDELDSYTRCISRVMPRLPQNYNSGTQIFQTPDYVVLHYEQFDRRVIPLDGRPHVGSRIRQWNGDSRGHWEGDTLVVDVTHFNDPKIVAEASELVTGTMKGLAAAAIEEQHLMQTRGW